MSYLQDRLNGSSAVVASYNQRQANAPKTEDSQLMAALDLFNKGYSVDECISIKRLNAMQIRKFNEYIYHYNR